ncbi:acylphosphatase-2 isoform X2 [Manis pentadactyla]|uniref:acylphosphatase-2 isoform X2 n=1 Tax=Manis pentadactyla TaxID=143292 RepID=UPI00255CB4B4|nr:acylphosphatase-2 isoform X2 [Manis pentadactyla]
MRPFLLAAAAVTAPRVPLRLLGRGLAAAMSTAGPLKSVDYEVFGRVQGVCFRMYTEDEAKKIGVVGWVKNTSKGTVTGQVQGPEKKVNSMTSSTALKGNAESGHLVLFLILEEKLSPLIIKCDVSSGLVTHGFYHVNICSFYA